MKRRLKPQVKLYCCLICLLTVELGVMPTVSYLSSYESHTNKFGIHSNEIEIHEQFDPVPPSLRENKYTKKVKIENTGKLDCYVRVFLDFEDDDIREKSQLFIDENQTYTLEEYKQNPPENWRYYESGDLKDYFYYEKPLEPGMSTTPLIEGFTTTFSVLTKNIDVIVYAESIQAYDPLSDSQDYKTIWESYLSRS